MSAVILVLLSIVTIAAVFSLFMPVLRGVRDPLLYFRSRKTPTDALLLKKRMLLENIRDTMVEKEQNKLSQEEFQNLTDPLTRQVDEIEKEIRIVESASLSPRKRSKNEKTIYCRACGARQGKLSANTDYCIQCGQTPL